MTFEWVDITIPVLAFFKIESKEMFTRKSDSTKGYSYKLCLTEFTKYLRNKIGQARFKYFDVTASLQWLHIKAKY